MGLMPATPIVRHFLVEADMQVRWRFPSRAALITYPKMYLTGRFARSGTTPKSREPGGTRLSIYRRSTTRKRKGVIRCSTSSTVVGKTKPDGFRSEERRVGKE